MLLRGRSAAGFTLGQSFCSHTCTPLGCQVLSFPNKSHPPRIHFFLLFFLCSVRETHQVAEAQQEKNAKLREAFGISEFFVEGSSLDPQRRAKEAAAKAAVAAAAVAETTRYEIVRTPTPPEEPRAKKRHARSEYVLFKE